MSNYPRPHVDSDWSLSRDTHPAVATAIHAIADRKRNPESIWEAPTPTEWEHVHMAVEQYLRDGDFPLEPDNRYAWGQESVCMEWA